MRVGRDHTILCALVRAGPFSGRDEQDGSLIVSIVRSGAGSPILSYPVILSKNLLTAPF